MANLVERKIIKKCENTKSQRSFSWPAKLDESGEKKKSSWELVKIECLPTFLNDNEFLLTNHRPELNSVSECFKSIFVLHTETLNVWTHFIGAATVTWLFFNHMMNSTSQWQQTLYFALFFVGAITCMTLSAVFHTLLCHSEPVFKLLAKLDYCGVILLITTSYFLWIHFGFYCEFRLKLLYLVILFILSCICIAVVTQDRFCNPQFGFFRAALFISLGLKSVVPGVHFIIIEHYKDVPSASISWLICMGILYIIGGFAYATKIPERIRPGRFDVWFQSHQILHLAVIAGVLLCYKGVLILEAERNSQTCKV